MKEQKRLEILNKVLAGIYGEGEVAHVVGLSERQLWRLLGAYRKEGAKALALGNRGHKPANAISQEER